MARKKRNDEQGSEATKGNRARKRRAAGESPAQPSEGLVNQRQMHALSREERIRILAIFTERVASPKEISEELNKGLSQVSYHVSVLRECRLIAEDHKVPRHGAVEHFYRAATPTLISPNTWDRLPAAVREGISASILEEFFDDASASLAAGLFDDSPGELSWTPLILDSLGVEEIGQLGRALLVSVFEVQAAASKRLQEAEGKGTAEPISATVFLASFLSARSPEDGKKASATKRR